MILPIPAFLLNRIEAVRVDGTAVYVAFGVLDRIVELSCKDGVVSWCVSGGPVEGLREALETVKRQSGDAHRALLQAYRDAADGRSKHAPTRE
jgi:hypothetical protein